MDRCLKQWIALALAAPLISAGTGFASTPDHGSQLEKLNDSLLEAKAANRAIRFELDEARVEYFNDDSINEERATAITAIVHQMLLDSDTRMHLRGERAMLGWNNGFHMRSADGRFLLDIGGFTQARFMARWTGTNNQDSGGDFDQWRYSFGQPRTVLHVGGHAFGRGLDYYMSMGWGRFDPDNLTASDQLMSFRMWEAWIKFKLTQNFQIKLGQFTLPFTRESLIRPTKQMAVEKTTIDHRFGMAESQGVEFDWVSDERRFKLAFTNGSPSFFQPTVWENGEPTPPWPALQRDTLYSVTMRHEWKLLGDWDQFSQFTSPPGSQRGVLLGIAGHRQNIELDSSFPFSELPDGLYWGLTGDVTLQYDGASLYAAVIYERLKDFGRFFERGNLFAYILQGSTYVTNQTEVFARWEAGGTDIENFGDEELQLLTVGMNHYIDGQDVKFTADIGLSFGEVSLVIKNTSTGWRPDKRKFDQVVLRTQLQFMF